MESQGQIAVSNVCRAVVRAVEKLDEEWSPATLDVMIFHSNQLYRLGVEAVRTIRKAVSTTAPKGIDTMYHSEPYHYHLCVVPTVQHIL